MLIALALTACAPADIDEEETTAAPDSTEGEEPNDSPPAEDPETGEDPAEDADETDDVLVADIDDPVEIAECAEAEDDDESTVTWLDDIVIPEEHHDGVDDVTVEIGGETVTLPGAPAIVVPERVGQAGCIIEYDAPGACLPAVEISPAHVPGFTLPERSIPEFELPDGTVLSEVVQDERHISPAEEPGTRREEACQPDESELDDGDYVPLAHRSIAVRTIVVQSVETQSIQTRSVQNTDGGVVPQMVLPQIVAPQLVVPQVVVPQEVLEAYQLEGAEDTERTDGEEDVSYITEGDVLFDSDEYELRSDAESELQAIADDIAERDDDYLIDVEGHTDDLPTSVYEDNDELSELRAGSVADWLIDNSGVDADAVTTSGLGEDIPRADNSTDEGRQQNRRVVITVRPADGSSDVEYELEDD